MWSSEAIEGGRFPFWAPRGWRSHTVRADGLDYRPSGQATYEWRERSMQEMDALARRSGGGRVRRDL